MSADQLPERPAPALDTPEINHRHRDVSGGWLRPTVFGASDGLVSNFALVAGVAGANVGSDVVVITGIAGMLAGSLSMAVGEWVSVASQTELTRAEIAVEKHELSVNAAEEERELALMYEARGLRPELAAEVARELSADPEVAWRVHAREELGVDPDDLPSPWVAAWSSFLSFCVGAILPVIPYLLGGTELLWAAFCAGAGLFLLGAVVARFTARPWWFSGARQLLLGAAAAAATFGIGSLLGAHIT